MYDVRRGAEKGKLVDRTDDLSDLASPVPLLRRVGLQSHAPAGLASNDSRV